MSTSTLSSKNADLSRPASSLDGESPLPEFDGLLRACRSRILLHHFFRGVFDFILTLCLCLLVAGLVDFVLPLPSIARFLMLLGTIVVTVFVAWTRWFRPMIVSVSSQELAAAVDMAFPELHEGVATLISVNSPDASKSETGSALMCDHLRRQLRGQISGLSASTVVRGNKTLQHCALIFVAVLIAALPAMLWPATSLLLMQRLWTPFANLDAATNLYFEIPDANRTVPIGSDVTFAAIPKWRHGDQTALPENVRVELRTQQEQTDWLLMKFDEVRGEFSAILPAAQQTLFYRITSGRTKTSWFELKVVDPPTITAIELISTPPAYTGRPVERIEGVVGSVVVFERSQVELRVQFTKPVIQARLVWKTWKPISSEIAVDEFMEDAMPLEDMSPDVSPEQIAAELTVATASNQHQEPPVEGSLSLDGTEAVFHFNAVGGGRFELDIRDADSLSLPEEPERVLTVLEDVAPTLRVTGLQDETDVRPDDVAPLDCNVTDDFCVSTLEFLLQKNEETVRVLPAEGFQSGLPQVLHRFRLPLAEYDLHSGDMISIRVRTTDNRPVPEPHLVIRGPWILRIRDDADPLAKKALTEENEAILDELTELANQLTADIETGNQLRNDLWKQWDKTTRDGIRSLSEKEQLQGRRLQEIAAEIATHPLLHDIAEELAEIGGAVRFDIPNSLNDAIPKQRDEAAKSLQDGINGIHAARDRLKRVIQQYQERAKIEQDLTELNRLALEAEELARQSQELKQDREGNQPEPGQTQDEFEKELKDREEHIQQEQKQLASDLEDLLKRRDELLQAARRSQLEKLEQIGKKAAQLAEDQQQVADGVAEESRDAARDASNLADRLQQMRNEAQQIQQQLQELQQAAAGPLDPQTDEATAKASSSSIDDAIRALRQGDLQDAQQDLEKLEEQLRQSASQLASNADRADSPRSEEADAAPDTGSSEQEKASEEARRIAKQLSDVRQQIEQLKESRGLSQQNPNEDGAQKTSRNDDQNNQARTSGSLEERAPGSSQASVEEDLIQRLRQLVDASAEIAEDVQQSASPPDAKTAAQAAADKARQSISEADAGQFSKAAGSMRESADQARQVVSQIEDGGLPDQQSQLTGIAAELNQLADVFDRLQQDNAAQLGAQQSSQQRLTNETQSLPAQLDELAERLNLEALGTQQQGRQAGEAARAAAEAADSTNQASEQLRQSQLQQASQSGHEAAGQLNRAAQLAQQGSQRPQDSNPVIPSEVGDSVTDALNNLKQAERPGQGNQSSPAGDQSSPNPASGTEASDEPSAQQGQPGQEQSQAGEGQQSPGDAAQQSSGQQPGSQGTQGADAASTSDSGAQQENQAGSNGADANGMTHSTDNLSKAAEALQNAAKGVLPADMTPGQMQESPGASGKAKAGTGNDQLFDGRTPGRTAGRGRGWFNPELNDDLEDGLSEQGREVIDSEYAELIRNYRRKLAQDRGKK